MAELTTTRKPKLPPPLYADLEGRIVIVTGANT